MIEGGRYLALNKLYPLITQGKLPELLVPNQDNGKDVKIGADKRQQE